MKSMATTIYVYERTNNERTKKVFEQQIKHAQHGYDTTNDTQLANIYFTRIEVYELLLTKIKDLEKESKDDKPRRDD